MAFAALILGSLLGTTGFIAAFWVWDAGFLAALGVYFGAGLGSITLALLVCCLPARKGKAQHRPAISGGMSASGSG